MGLLYFLRFCLKSFISKSFIFTETIFALITGNACAMVMATPLFTKCCTHPYISQVSHMAIELSSKF